MRNQKQERINKTRKYNAVNLNLVRQEVRDAKYVSSVIVVYTYT